MARRLGWLGLLVFLMLGAVVWTLWPAPCSKPVAYRLGPVDDRFGLSGDEVLAALGEAGALWEHGLGRKLFTYEPRWFKSRARNHLQANRSLGFCFEIPI